MRYIGTIRFIFDSNDDAEAHLVLERLTELLSDSDFLDEDDIAEVTQVIPLGLTDQISPEEVVAQLRRSVDLLINTRVIQCIELGRELDKVAWILEHRGEASFDASGYPYGDYLDKMEAILKRGDPNAKHS